VRAEDPNPIPLWPDNPSSLDLLGFADIAEPVLDAPGRERLDPVAVGSSAIVDQARRRSWS
jgi:hypothetical protein